MKKNLSIKVIRQDTRKNLKNAFTITNGVIMNKQLLLLATLVATQASVNAFDTDAMKTMENMQALSQQCIDAKSWIPESLKNTTSASGEYVSETVVPFATNSFGKAKECCSDVKAFLGNFGKATPTRFESFKASLLSLKDSAVAYVSSFNKPTMPSWETTKNAVNGFKESTKAAMQQACQSIKENAPVYFDAAKKYVEENPGKATAITAGSIATMFAIYKTVKYFRNSDELYRDYDSVVEPIKHAVRR